ncbi:MAG: MATE family efflux transporter, partial [Endozoicomonas sp.]
TPTVAHLYGARKTAEIGAPVRQGLWIALASSLLAVAFLHNTEALYRWLEVDLQVASRSIEYLKALSWGVPAVCLYQALGCYCEGMGKTKPAMVFSFMALLLNIPVNYVLIYGKFGFPELGGIGCGYATAVCFWLMFFLMSRYTMLSRRHQGVGLFSHWDWPDIGLIRSQIKLGVPIGLAIFFEAGIFSAVALVIGKLGAVIIAGHQVALNFSSLTFMIPLSLSMGVTIRVGQALGAGKPEAAAYSSYAGIMTTVLMATASASLMWFFPELVASIYTKDSAVSALAAQLLVYAALFQYADAIQIASNGALRGYKDTRIPMVMVLFSCWGIAFPLGYTLGMTDYLVEPMGPHGFWIGLVSALSIGAVLLSIRLRKISCRHILAAQVQEPVVVS